MIEDQPSAPQYKEPLAVRLRKEPTQEERDLAQQVGLSDVQGVPAHMFVKVAVITDRHDRWHDRIDRAWARVRRYVIGAVLAAATSVSGLVIDWLHADEARVAAAEHAAAGEREFREYRRNVEKEMSELRLDIRELRTRLDAALHRLGVAEPPGGISIVQREEHAP